jgi:hypothetical protein
MARPICFYRGATALLVMVTFLLSAHAVHAQLAVIGNWEQATSGGNTFTNTDSWLDWTSNSGYAGGAQGTTLPGLNGSPTLSGSAVYSSSTIGATLGSQSLEVSFAGYNQDLAIKLEYATDLSGNSAMADFLKDKKFSIDITYPAQNDPSGYQEIYQLVLNATGYGYTNAPGPGQANPVTGTHVNYGAGPTNNNTFTLSFNYGSLIGTGQSQIPPTANYAEIIFTTNTDGTSPHDQFYFDNARLYTPGDMNNDGHVDAGDIVAMEMALANPAEYQTTFFNNNPNYVASDLSSLGDVNGDGVFNNADVQALINLLQSGGGSLQSVPEPASWALLALALPAVLAVGKKRAKSR